MDAAMMRLSLASIGALIFFLFLVGCRTPRKPSTTANPSVARGTSQPLRPLAIPQARPNPVTVSDSEDPTFLIPPPPQLASLTKERTLPLPTIPPSPEESPDLKNTSSLTSNPKGKSQDPTEDLKKLYNRAVECYDKMDSFEARLTRQEVVDNKRQPKETIRFQFRKKPMSVRMKWIGDEGNGREVLYVQGKYDNKMQILPAKSDTAPLPPFKMSMAPDDPTVRSKSRHDIREAALAEAINHLGSILKLIESNPKQADRLKYLGSVKRPEYPYHLDGIEETIPANAEKGLPKGGKRLTFWDPTAKAASEGLPVIVITYDEKQREVEYYCFDRFLHPVQLDDRDFDASKMGRR
jgi:hypothetical protein